MEFSKDYNPMGFTSLLEEIRHYLKHDWNASDEFNDIPVSCFWWEDQEGDDYNFYIQQDDDLDFDWELD